MEPTPPGKVAVLVVDVQAGLFLTDKPPLESSAVVERINGLTSKARAAGLPVIFIQHDGPEGGNWLAPFSAGWQLHPGLEVSPGDPVIRKTTGDAFYGTPLAQELRSRKVTTVVIVGYATDFCIDATLRSAVSRDLGVILVADAHTTDDGPVLKAGSIREHFNWVWQNSSSRRGIRVLRASEVKFNCGSANPA